MNKGLEALENIKHYDSRVGLHEDDYKIIETELKRLEELEKEWEMEHTLRIRLENINYERAEVLRIIKEKKVDIALLKLTKTEPEYLNHLCHRVVIEKQDYQLGYRRLTQEEYDLLKEWLK